MLEVRTIVAKSRGIVEAAFKYLARDRWAMHVQLARDRECKSSVTRASNTHTSFQKTTKFRLHSSKLAMRDRD